MTENKFSADAWMIVRARIEAMPAHLKLAIGGVGEFDKEELLEQVDKRTEIGELLVQVHFNYLRSFKKEVQVLNV